AIVHGYVDHTGVGDFIRPDTLHIRGFNRGLDEILVGHVEVERLAGFEIDLLAETHDDEAGFPRAGFVRTRGSGGVAAHGCLPAFKQIGSRHRNAFYCEIDSDSPKKAAEGPLNSAFSAATSRALPSRLVPCASRGIVRSCLRAGSRPVRPT